MSLEQNNTKVNLSAEDEATLYELQRNAVEGVLALFGDSYASLSDADREAVTVELGREFYAHPRYLDEIVSEFEKERSLKFYLDRIANKSQVIKDAPADLRTELESLPISEINAVATIAKKSGGDWSFFRNYLERERERHKIGTTWQDLPFIGYVRHYIDDELIEKALTVNGELLDVWSGNVGVVLQLDGSFSLCDLSKKVLPDGGTKCHAFSRFEIPELWQLVLFVLIDCHKAVIEESQDINLTGEQKIKFAQCTLDAFAKTCFDGNRVFADLAENYDGDIRLGFWHFTHYLLNEWLKAKTDEDKKAVSKDWFTAKIVLGFNPWFFAKSSRVVIADHYRAPVNDNRFIERILATQPGTKFTTTVGDSNAKFEFGVHEGSPTLTYADFHVLFAIYAYKESNKPRVYGGFTSWDIKVIDLVSQMFPCEKRNIKPDSVLYKFVRSSIDRLSKFKHTFDMAEIAQQYSSFDEEVLLSRDSDTMITGKWGWVGNGTVRHEAFSLQAMGLLVPLYKATEWSNTVSIYRDYMPRNIYDEATIHLALTMINRAAARLKTLHTVPLYERNSVRVSRKAFSLFREMRRFGWVDTSVDKGDTEQKAKALENKDRQQRERVLSILRYWEKLKCFELSANIPLDVLDRSKAKRGEKLEWYKAKLLRNEPPKLPTQPRLFSD